MRGRKKQKKEVDKKKNDDKTKTKKETEGRGEKTMTKERKNNNQLLSKINLCKSHFDKKNKNISTNRFLTVRELLTEEILCSIINQSKYSAKVYIQFQTMDLFCS